MSPRRCLLCLAAIPLLLVPTACATHAEDTSSPTEMRDGEAAPEGRRLELTIPAEHAEMEQIHALLQHIESQADVGSARAEVKKGEDGGPAEVVVELWGQDMPTDDEFAAELEDEFPWLTADAVIVSPLDVEATPMPAEGEPEDPEQLRAQIIDDLRAKGVTGEIDVEITDHPDGRREVEVSVHDDEDAPAE
ncbi:MAG: hypothetical protein AAF799_05420 [Myxococcota bacterium]